MYSAEVSKYRRQQQKYGAEPRSYEELKALVNLALNPPRKPYTRHKKKEDCNYRSRPILVYSADGRFIGEFLSVSEASRFTSVYPALIHKCLKKEIPSAKDYVFLDKSDDYEVVIKEQADFMQ